MKSVPQKHSKKRGPAPKPLTDRFWAKVDKGAPGECWLWTGIRTSAGYGSIWTGDGTRLAHRISWELANRASADGLDVRHSCDNPRCVNPEHLSIGSRSENIRDSVIRGRRRCLSGGSNPGAKLSAEQVSEIRSRYRRFSHDSNCETLGKEFGVSTMTISRIVRGERWR